MTHIFARTGALGWSALDKQYLLDNARPYDISCALIRASVKGDEEIPCAENWSRCAEDASLAVLGNTMFLTMDVIMDAKTLAMFPVADVSSVFDVSREEFVSADMIPGMVADSPDCEVLVDIVTPMPAAMLRDGLLKVLAHRDCLGDMGPSEVLDEDYHKRTSYVLEQSDWVLMGRADIWVRREAQVRLESYNAIPHLTRCTRHVSAWVNVLVGKDTMLEVSFDAPTWSLADAALAAGDSNGF